MATMTETKKAALIALLGPIEAAKVLKQVEQTEKAADLAGIAYKERRSAAAPFADAPGYLPPAASGIGAVMGRK